MTARKRKAPDRRKKPVKDFGREPGMLGSVLKRLLPGLLSSACRYALRHPRGVGGSLCVAVAGSFVMANALWYQPGGHPHPFLRTRDAEHPDAIAGYRPAPREPAGDVTTFRIERQDLAERPANQPEGGPSARPVPVDLPEATAATGSRSAPFEDPLVTRQAATMPALSTPDLTKDPAHNPMHNPGQASLQTAAPQTPAPGADVPPNRVVVPLQRPAGDLKAEDPVAVAIRAAERRPAAAPPKPPSAAPQPPREVAQSASARQEDQVAAQITNAASNGLPLADVDLVMQIQRGLANIAYTDVQVDGVAGAQTRAAIRHFQKHYRLAETGEPSDAVLKKLKSIGAL